MKRKTVFLLAAMLVLSTTVTGCGKSNVTSEEKRPDLYENVEEVSMVFADASETDTEDTENTSGLKIRQIKDVVLEDKTAVNIFTDEPFGDGNIKDNDDALNALNEFMKDAAGYDDLGFAFADVSKTKDGSSIFAFWQTGDEGRVESMYGRGECLDI